MSTLPRTRPSPPDRNDRRDVTAPVGLIAVAAGLAGIILAAAVTGTSVSPLVWYLARAAGFTLYLLLWLSVVTGLGLTTKLLDWIIRREDTWMFHRFTTELAFAFLALHLLTLAIDPTVGLGPLGILLPMMSDVRQPWTDIGIVTAWGMIAVAMSFSFRRLLGQKGWRLLHYSAFPLWVMALVHGIGAGTDTRHLWALFLYVSTTATVLFLSLYRLLISNLGRRALLAPSRSERASLSREQPVDQE